MKLNGSFGNWLKQRRKALDLTQLDVADQVSCSVVTIRKIEGDVARPSKQIAERLAEVLAVSPAERAAFVSFARRLAAHPPDLPVDLPALLPAHNLPSQLTPFIGRESELAQIAERLADPACRLLTLVGPGGIGKTRLALEAAANQLAYYEDGVTFVSLASVNSHNLLASTIAAALNIAIYGPDDPNAQIAAYLHESHML